MSRNGALPGSTMPAALKLALAQGVAAPLLLALVAILGGASRPGYSHLSQAISELTEAGAADKVWLDPMLALMELLTIAFGIGFFVVVRRRGRSLRLAAGMLVFIGVIGLGFARYPIDPMGSPITGDGRMHMIIVAVSAIAAMAAVLSSALGWRVVPGAGGLGRFSLAMLALMLASGVISALVGMNGWTGIGIWQRVNTGAFGLWQIATAVFLLRHGARLRAAP